ncbi:hypothetical protein I8H89_01775, partial [Candidatus Saccharibacteria bacterium]|nr:hypothetical protein [Candidatus Saccharibacteria bacterium]
APAAQPAPAPQPVATPAPVAAAPSNEMPQPTAPFSSPRPATLGERVIQPMDSPEATEDIASRIAAELAGAGLPSADTPPQTQAPQAPPPAPQQPAAQ